MELLGSFETLSPFVVPKVWGGTALRGRAEDSREELIGESWEVSRLKGESSTSAKGGLDRLLSFDELPYLVKYIEAMDKLSIQVHPHDEYASRVEKCSGKMECWLILRAEKESGVYLGFRSGTRRDQFLLSLERGEDISSFLNFYPVSPGTFIRVPPRTIHALGGGLLLLEIQQSLGITYRLWDWNRKRELHREKGLEVLTFRPEHNEKSFFHFREDIFSKRNSRLIEFKDFTVESFSLDKGEQNRLEFPKNGRYRSLILLQGRGILTLDDSDKEINYHETILINKNVYQVGFHCLKKSRFVLIY